MIFIGGQAEILQVQDNTKKPLNLFFRLHLKEFVADDDHAVDCALLLSLLQHFEGHQ